MSNFDDKENKIVVVETEQNNVLHGGIGDFMVLNPATYTSYGVVKIQQDGGIRVDDGVIKIDPDWIASKIDTFIFTQSVASNVWEITHTLQKSRPSVTVVDSAEDVIGGAEVSYIDDTHIKLTFSAAFAGKAFLN